MKYNIHKCSSNFIFVRNYILKDTVQDGKWEIYNTILEEADPEAIAVSVEGNYICKQLLEIDMLITVFISSIILTNIKSLLHKTTIYNKFLQRIIIGVLRAPTTKIIFVLEDRASFVLKITKCLYKECGKFGILF